MKPSSDSGNKMSSPQPSGLNQADFPIKHLHVAADPTDPFGPIRQT